MKKLSGEKLPCKKIDIHTHLSLAPGSMTAECRLRVNERLGIEKSVILPVTDYMEITRHPFHHMAMAENSDACQICLRYPEAFSWFCNVCPDGTKETYKFLRRCKEQGACGVGEFASQLYFDEPVMEHLFAGCEELGLPFLFHLSPQKNWGYGLVDSPGLVLLEKELRKFPGLIFIGHSKAFWYEIAQGPEHPSPALRNSCVPGTVKEGRLAFLFREYPNLWGDLSASGGGHALIRDEEYGLSFIKEFSDRLMFGTDILREQDLGPLGGWLDEKYEQGKLSREDYKNVCRDNAKKLLSI